MQWYKSFDYGLLLPALARLPVPWANRLADRRGDLTHWLRGRARRKAIQNLREAIPGLDAPQAGDLIRQTYRVLSHDEMESYWFDRPLSSFQSRVAIEGVDLLQKALQSGTGVVLYTGHLGCTGTFITTLGKMGIPISLVFRSLDEVPGMPASWYRYGNQRIALLERAVRRPILYTGRSGYFAMRSKIRQGEAILMGLDVIPSYMKRTVTAHFFGRPARFPEGLSRLILDTRPTTLLWDMHLAPGGRHQGRIIDLSPALKELRNPQAVTQVLVSRLEQRIREHPQDWLLWPALQDFFVEQEGTE